MLLEIKPEQIVLKDPPGQTEQYAAQEGEQPSGKLKELQEPVDYKLFLEESTSSIVQILV